MVPRMKTIPAIHARGLGKRFPLGERQRYRSLRDDVMALFGARRPADAEWNWALRDLDLDVAQGESIGIVGGNGAGKSTLLRILARITEPTCGEATIIGRVGSLLEVGTGFHPELTGRENIWLAGAVLGMSRAHVAKQFDAIVVFAETERFLELPVKRYSTGMQMRLAFAVAAHLEPDVLIVDEVLAVGDARFQARCLARMDEAARSGCTVLMVSHNMPSIRRLCRRALWLERGVVRMAGTADDVVAGYLHAAAPESTGSDFAAQVAALPADPDVRLEAVTVEQAGRACMSLLAGEPFVITVRWRALRSTSGLRIYIDIHDEDQVLLCRLFHDEAADVSPPPATGGFVSRVEIPADALGRRIYHVTVGAVIFGERYCTGDGVGIRLDMVQPGRLNRAHGPGHMYNRMHPGARWMTRAEQA